MAERDVASATGVRPARRRFGLLLAPAAAFVGLLAVFALGLQHDPRLVPSPLIGKPVPTFSLAPVKGHSLGLSSNDLRGQVTLVNVFASWCVACREEHALLVRLGRERVVPIEGLDYKDKPDDAVRWLATMGDPYTRTGADDEGRVAIDWGVYGVPETFVVDKSGRIAYKQVGPITPDVLEHTLLPLIERLRREPAAAGAAG
jgi:cytochrome c biogenesis protein CcmG/thiol:disulfide interchange protein DsbE